MDRSKKLRVIGIGCLVLVSVSTASRADSAPCEKNFTVEEGLFNRKVYKTWHDFLLFAPQTIFNRTYTSLVKDGWIINSLDKESGIIFASQLEGSPGEGGKVASLNIIIENARNYFEGIKGAVRISMILSVPSGLHESDDMVRKNFCDLVTDIKK